MKQPLTALMLTLTACLFAPSLRADDSDKDKDKDKPNPNWFSFGPSLHLNMNVKFKDMPVANGSGGAHGNYVDGYVREDSSGDAGGKTWNWGYNNASQVQGNSLTLHGTTSTAVSGDSLSQDGDPQWGLDLAYGRDLGHVLGGTWGLQAAFDFTSVSISDNQPFTGKKMSFSDVFSLGGIIVPQAPYAGSFNGPGPLIGDTPTSSTSSSQAVLLAGQRTLDAQVYALRMGPYYELGFCKRFAARLGGGLTLALTDTKLSYSGGALVGSGSSEGMDFQAGAYIEGLLLFSVTHHLGLFAGAQYEYLGTYDRNAGIETAQLDMTGAVSVLFGAQWAF
jgi:hypothetical protein